MADRTEGTIEIAASPAAVMSEIADFDAYPSWSSEIKAVEVLERDPEGRGAKVRFEVSAGGIFRLSVTYVLAYVYEENDAGVSWSFVEGQNIRDLSGSYHLEAIRGGRTKVTYQLRVDLPIPVPGFVRRQGEKRVIGLALDGLKRRVESRKRGP